MKNFLKRLLSIGGAVWSGYRLYVIGAVAIAGLAVFIGFKAWNWRGAWDAAKNTTFIHGKIEDNNEILNHPVDRFYLVKRLRKHSW